MTNKKLITILCMGILSFWLAGTAFAAKVELKTVLAEQKGTEYALVSEGFVLVKNTEGQYGYMDLKGKLVIPYSFDYASAFYNGIAEVSKDDQTYFINGKGERVFSVEDLMKQYEDEYLYVEAFSKEGIARFVTNGYTGYIGSDGKTILKPKYETATDFENGYAMVSDDLGSYIVDKTGKIKQVLSDDITYGGYGEGLIAYMDNQTGLYGYRNDKNKVVIEAKFKYANGFKHGYAVVSAKKGVGLIDKTGKWAIEPRYEQIQILDNGFIKLMTSYSTFYLRKDLKPVFKLQDDLIANEAENFWVVYGRGYTSVIDQNGVTYELKGRPYWLGDTYFMDDKGNLAEIKGLISKNTAYNESINIYETYSYKYINAQGQEVLDLKYYDAAYPFQEGLAKIKKDGQYNFIDKNGKVISKMWYDQAGNFEDGKAWVVTGEDYYYLAKDGSLIKDQTEAEPVPEIAGDYAVITKNYDQYGLVDKANKFIVEPIYDGIFAQFEGEIYIIKKGELFGFFIPESKKIIDAQYTDYYIDRKNKEIIVSDEKEQYGVIDYQGKVIIDRQYSLVKNVDSLFYLIKKGDQFGLMDQNSKWILPLENEDLSVDTIGEDESQYMIRYVHKGQSKLKVYQTKEKKVIDIPAGIYIESYTDGVYLTTDDAHKYYVDSKGKILYTSDYYLYPFQNGYGIVETGEKAFLVDKNGKKYLENQGFESIYGPVEGLVIYLKEGKYGLVNLEGKFITKEEYDLISTMDSGVVGVYIDGKSTYVNSKGEEIIARGKYDYIFPFSDGLGLVVEIKE